MYKIFLSAIVALLFAFVSQAQYSLVKLWETDSTSLKIPESVIFDNKRNQLYVTNIEGESWKKDSVGSIAILHLDGSIKKLHWITGLHAPKGMGIVGNKLYVADLDRIVVVNIKKGKVKKIIPIAGATHLNDVTVGTKGMIYASETVNRAVYSIDKSGYIKKLLDSNQLKRPNGLHVAKGLLHILDNGRLLQLQSDQQLKILASDMEGGTDGLETIGDKSYIISCWQGAIWHVNLKGEKQLLLDTRAAKRNTADIGINETKNIIYVPGFFTNTVSAYKLQSN